MKDRILLNGKSLTIDGLVAISRHNHPCTVPIENQRFSADQRLKLEKLITEELPVYGLNTGVGHMVNFALSAQNLREFQLNLVRSHSVGTGVPFNQSESRAILAARTNTLAKGFSAVRPALLQRLEFYLNANIIPVIPQQGSLGASGDLAPLSHLALTVFGEGSVFGRDGRATSTRHVLSENGIDPLELDFKEGLSLINGTSAMTGVGALVVSDGWNQLRQAELITSTVLQALRASSAPFAQCGHDQARPYAGQIASASNLRTLNEGSQLLVAHPVLTHELQEQRINQDPVTGTNVFLQKAYSLRACPQIFGAVRNSLAHAESILNIELNSANDNPLFIGDEVFHGANFHGQPIACVLDYLFVTLMQIGILSERRLNRLVHPALSNLPPFLVGGEVGFCCGFAGAQYLATSLVAEMRTIGTASNQSIPSNGDNQDVVSMGLIAARNARRVLDLNCTILAVELLAGLQAIDLLVARDQLSPAGQLMYGMIRNHVPTLGVDRSLAHDIETVAELLRHNELIATVAKQFDLH